MQICDFWTSIPVSAGSRSHLSLGASKTACLASELLVSKGPRPHLRFCVFKRATLGPELYVSMCPSNHLWFMHAKQWLLDENTSPYGYQTSPVVLCKHNGMISTKMTSLYDFQLSSVVFACKTATFEADLQVSMCPWPHLSLCACKTACLASESLVSMGPRPHLWILIAKLRLLVQNYKSLWVPDLTYRFVKEKQRD